MIQQVLSFIEFGIVFSLCLLGVIAVSRQLPTRLKQLLVGAYFIRVFAAVVVDQLGTFFGQADFGFYHRSLWEVAVLFREGVVTAPLEIQDIGGGLSNLFIIPYTAMFSPVYAIFGDTTLLARLVFALVGTLVVFNAYRLGKLLHGESTGLYTAGLTAIFPYWLYLSVIFYRDMLIILILSQFLYMLLDWLQSGKTRIGIGALGPAAFGFILRPENIFIIGITLALGSYGFVKRVTPVLSGVTIAGIVIGAFGLLRRVGINGTSISLSGFMNERRALTDGTGAYLPDVAFQNIIEFIGFVPIGTIYFLLVPFPWQVHNILAMLALFQNVLIWYPMLALAVVGFRYSVAQRPGPSILLVVFTLSGMVAYGIVEGNMGPALRHRSQFQFPVVIFAAVALSKNYSGVSQKIKQLQSRKQIRTSTQEPGKDG